ncbi:MAG: SURF1 family cytochrome oxidase biogenesis protein [Pseudolysinimonas sp.]
MASLFWAVARRPRWIAALLLCLAIAGGFAALGQWQLSRSVENVDAADAPDSEVAVPLASIAQPQTEVTQPQLGRRVTVDGELVPGDFTVLTGRNNGGAADGAWLVGHFITVDGATLAIALGWAPDAASAEAAGSATPPAGPLEGRYLPSESPTESDFEAGERSAISVADLINIWPEAQPAYGGYLVLDQAWPGLEQIYSPAPSREIGYNLLNIFYALEWAIFAGFAIYLWYRLVRDVVEREHPDLTSAEATVE